MIAIVLAAVLAQGYYTPAEAQAVYGQANDAYYREDYAAATGAYEQLLERGYGGPDLLYNLGTAYLAQNDLGRAVLYLERARRAGGPTSDIDANLAVARSRQLDQVVGAQAEEPFFSRLTAATREHFAAWAFLACWCLCFLGLALFRVLTPGRRTWTLVLAGIAFALSLPTGAVLAAHVYQAEAVQEAVVIAPTARARELPKDGGKVSFEVHAGLKVRAFEQAGSFVRIRLPNGLEGWTERTAIADL